MVRPLAPLNQLHAFEAAARLGGFVAAATELNVTPGAVSHQVKALEARLGVVLFERLAQGVRLTDAGRRLLPGISDGFARLESAARGVHQAALAGPLVISMLSGFAAGWFAPRLRRFAERFPDLQLTLRAEARRIDFRREAVDLAIRYGTGLAPDLTTRWLCGETVFPVCAPSLLTQGPPRDLQELARLPLLHDIDAEPQQPWMSWAGWLSGQDLPGLRFSDATTGIAAALAGQGVLLGRDVMLGDHLRTGRLVRPLPDQRAADWSYFLVAPAAHFDRPAVAAVAAWLCAEAAA